jgi:DNA-binding SARP family transcriptional activator
MHGTSGVFCGLASCAQKHSLGADDCGMNAASAGVWAERPIRIHTLGRFSVTVGSLALRASGKGKQRPAALLKALLALGGRDLAINQLWECLWPDSDGDFAARNLAVTLHRLREWLGSSATVLLHDGKLSLNEHVCWVDLWCFERCVNQGLVRPAADGDDTEAVMLLQRAFGLYRGHFLAFEAEQHWMLQTRLRLKAKFERLVTALEPPGERERAWSAAADVCLRGIECDPLNELLYRQLMRCYLAMGEYSSVLRCYRRCMEALAKGLGVQPGQPTQQIYLDAVRADARSAGMASMLHAGQPAPAATPGNPSMPARD